MKKKMTEAQLRNLKPAKKGEIRNPEGGRSHNPIRKLTLEVYRDIIEIGLTKNVEALKEVAENPKTPALQVAFAFALMDAIKNHKWEVVEGMVSRIVGKIPDQININSQNHTTLATIDEAKMKEVLKKLEQEV